ncbi:hypothetical protein CANINC_002991 [Pichia inconspicua]|uniref:Carboxymuconolactone decarboxylase-like domain-containing protein n=1 Tax=Pichia inconspicua TaxID=52247 RepID=A0A4V4NFJ8_9ASCO|nr:hypothetical protein CANINC_002991 [[Candida] inconspicua]
MSPILTAQRLHKLATWDKLSDCWYLIATVTLTVCNRPQEIPRLYHYALHTLYAKEQSNELLYQKVDSILRKFKTIKDTGEDLSFNPYQMKDGDSEELFRITDKFREIILKTAALSGLPKCINSMMQLKDHTPVLLRSRPNQLNRDKVENWDDYMAIQRRGKNYWDKVYTKISKRVENQMSSSYPDLWTYTIENVYSPLLSYNDIITADETSLVVIASLVPQDVLPQLKGHVKGALNAGISEEKVRETQEMASEIESWVVRDGHVKL